MSWNNSWQTGVDFEERVRANQQRLRSNFIVCGSGSSGSVVARRLAENPEVSVLLLEAGGDDNVPSVTEASQWPLNLETDWCRCGVLRVYKELLRRNWIRTHRVGSVFRQSSGAGKEAFRSVFEWPRYIILIRSLQL